MQPKLALSLIICLAWAPAWAGPVRCGDDGEGGACVWGRAEAYDGASLQVRGLKLTLMGITVPNRRDLCGARSGKEDFDCSRPARKRMGELLAKGVACDILDIAGDRLLGRCRVADGDLGRLLVVAGTARAAKDGPYEPDQATAMAARRGLWAADMVAPKDWDAARRKGEKSE
jgi:endonuclease YncB( thermonuclease family)